jgi:predicted permease
LQRTDLGFNPQGVLTARLTLPRAGYDEAKAAATIEAVVERLRSAPGVSHAAAMAWTPIVDGGGMWSVVADAVTPAANRDAPVAAPQQVTPDFFQAMSIPILRGRAFTTADKAGAELVGIVNESFSRLLWGSGDPIGRRFRMLSDGSKWITVVGLVPDTRVEGLTDAKPPVMYVPHDQAGESTYFASLGMTLAIRHAGDAAPLVAEIRRVVHDVDANVPLSDIRGLDDVVGASIARERFTTVLVAGFAVVAALLTGVGLYGVIAYGVAQRRFEIGVRMALGAAKGRILAEVVRRGVALAGAGLAIGLVGAIAVGVVLRSTLVGVAAFDAGVLGLVSILLLAVALAAIVVPARRAMRVSPTEALINR